MKRMAIFLDRDGVINREVDLLHRLDQIRLLPRAAEAIKFLNKNNILVICISNQPVVARGLVTEGGVEKINQEIERRLENKGAKIDKFYFCPHHPKANLKKYRKICQCRKPALGLIKRAKKDFNIDLENSFVIDDLKSGILMGKRMGLKTIRVLSGHRGDRIIQTGRGDEEEIRKIKPDFICQNLYQAVKLILKKIDK